jgi:ADP-dependent NAD(P)H-hydrate dehydratase / NAD(P)H-hydrate epimerase
MSAELLTNAEMTRADQLTIAAGTEGYTLMLRAGLAVAEAAMDLASAGPILIIAGRGNNGGDGFVAATELARRGCDVSVMLLCQRETLKGDAARAAQDWRGFVRACDASALGKPALIIDALFGAGLDRPVKGDPYDMIAAMNASGVPILSVDLPSGVNGSTGQVLGIAVNATESITFSARSLDTCCCLAARIADVCVSPISASATPCSTRSASRRPRTCRSAGGQPSRSRAWTVTSTRAVTCSSPPAA